MGIKINNNQSRNSTPVASKERESFLTKEISLFGYSFNSRKKELWYDELSVLLRSGIQLRQALELISETQKKAEDAKMIKGMLQKLLVGVAFSESIKAEKAFTDYEYYAIKIGEQTGQLSRVTEELSAFFKGKNDQRKEISSALTYPLIVLATAVVVVGFMLKYVVPMFVDIFKQNKVELPLITKSIISFSNFVSENGWLLLLVFGALIALFVWMVKKDWYHKIIGDIQLRIPVLGNYIKNVHTAQLTQAMALLVSAKVPIVDSMQLVSKMTNFFPLERALGTISTDVIEGVKLSKAFAKHAIFDKKMQALIRVAEETNQTEYIFEKLSTQYNHQLKHQSQIIANVLNPLLTLIVGLLVGIILVAMYLPMFRLSNVLG